MAKSDNMKLWDSVSETDPSHTKKVSFGRKFTAIDAHSQIMKATEAFGPAGTGWGWFYGEPQEVAGTIVIKCTLWHGDKGDTIEQFGQKALKFKDKTDEDAFKKAATDGLTKCLSYLGFNADVFLGKFDDNKYVEAVTAKSEITKSIEDTVDFGSAFTKWSEKTVGALKATTSRSELDGVVKAEKKQQDLCKQNDPTAAQAVTDAYHEMKEKFTVSGKAVA